jgi:hypothetical protein
LRTPKPKSWSHSQLPHAHRRASRRFWFRHAERARFHNRKAKHRPLARSCRRLCPSRTSESGSLRVWRRLPGELASRWIHRRSTYRDRFHDVSAVSPLPRIAEGMRTLEVASLGLPIRLVVAAKLNRGASFISHWNGDGNVAYSPSSGLPCSAGFMPIPSPFDCFPIAPVLPAVIRGVLDHD